MIAGGSNLARWLVVPTEPLGDWENYFFFFVSTTVWLATFVAMIIVRWLKVEENYEAVRKIVKENSTGELIQEYGVDKYVSQLSALIRSFQNTRGEYNDSLREFATLQAKKNQLENMLAETCEERDSLRSILYSSTVYLSEIVEKLWASRGMKGQEKRFSIDAKEACHLRRMAGTYALQALPLLRDEDAEGILNCHWDDSNLIDDTLKLGAFKEGNPFIVSLRERAQRLRVRQISDRVYAATLGFVVGDNYRRRFHIAKMFCIGKPEFDQEPWEICGRQLDEALRLSPTDTDPPTGNLLGDLIAVRIFVSGNLASGYTSASWNEIRSQLAKALTNS